MTDIIGKEREQSVVITPEPGLALEASVCTYVGANDDRFQCLTATTLQLESPAVLASPQVLGEDLSVNLETGAFELKSWMKALGTDMSEFTAYTVPPEVS
ncbi:MAG: hypothetical protein M3473_01775 [Chloroflexota bacterium]|nr:hypothetical protein [Chloroflexota bacterium]